MPESKSRPAAEAKRKVKRHEAVEHVRQEKSQKGLPNERRWVPPLFISVALLGVIWIVLWNVAAQHIPFMISLGAWNMLIGMGLIALSFILMTLWK
ncbi:MAG: cell division protein CrgA [Propionibacteriaceae bacterium]|nr:cell division protein CrgA [Propionibacteriaceae bacterium]MDR1213262.1 cell division protein CrgA [Propionibacteriaceae bacterium]